MSLTDTQRRALLASLEITVLLGQAIREAGETPSGHLYAHVMSHLSIQQFETLIQNLINAKCVSKRGDVLTWIGPAGQSPKSTQYQLVYGVAPSGDRQS